MCCSASALVFLASLFLPWRESTVSSTATSLRQQRSPGLLTQLRQAGPAAPTGGSPSPATSPSCSSSPSSSRPSRPSAARNSLRGCLSRGLGVALGYFAVAVAHEAHTLASELGSARGIPAPHELDLRLLSRDCECRQSPRLSGARPGQERVHALRRAPATQWRDSSASACSSRSSCRGSAFAWGGRLSVHGIEAPPAAIAALGLILGAGWLHGEAGRRWRCRVRSRQRSSPAGSASALAIAGGHVYGTWIGIGCAVSLVALEAVLAWPPCGFRSCRVDRRLVRVGAAAL